jgi:sulfoquinovosidase
LRHGTDGDRLIWNWELNYEYYPGWHEFTQTWRNAGIRVLTYINPFFSDPTNYTASSRRNFYQEGVQNGYFVKHNDGTPYIMKSLTIEFCMLDPTNEAAVNWIKSIIKDQLMTEASSSGWMADFGEYLPFDAVLSSGVPASVAHNLYPQMWAEINAAVQLYIFRELKNECNLFYMLTPFRQSQVLLKVLCIS